METQEEVETPKSKSSSTSTPNPGSLHSEPLNTPTSDNSTSEKLEEKSDRGSKTEDDDTVDLTGQGVRVNHRPVYGRGIETIFFSLILIFSFYKQEREEPGFPPIHYLMYLTHWQDLLNEWCVLVAGLSYFAEVIAALQGDETLMDALAALEQGQTLSYEQQEIAANCAHQIATALHQIVEFCDNPAMVLSLLTLILWASLLASTSETPLEDLVQHGTPWLVHLVGRLLGIKYTHSNWSYLTNFLLGAFYMAFTLAFTALGGTNEQGKNTVYDAYDPDDEAWFAIVTSASLALITSLTPHPHPKEAFNNARDMLRGCCQRSLNAVNTFTTWLGWGASSTQTNSPLSVNQAIQPSLFSPEFSSDVGRDSPVIYTTLPEEEHENVSNPPGTKIPQAEEPRPRAKQRGCWDSLCSNLPSFTFWHKAATDSKRVTPPTSPTVTATGKDSPTSETLPVPGDYEDRRGETTEYEVHTQ